MIYVQFESVMFNGATACVIKWVHLISTDVGGRLFWGSAGPVGHTRLLRDLGKIIAGVAAQLLWPLMEAAGGTLIDDGGC